ncbi:MAG: phenylalanine--tRNA ligase subunit beta, partial [Bdellovibrionota bacterium]
LGLKLEKPGSVRPLPQGLEFRASTSTIAIGLDAEELAPQFWGVELEGVRIGPSPGWLVSRLQAIGQRSINNVVDATNLLMFELGQPVHAYDANLIGGKKIGVMMGKAGEKLALLDGTTAVLTGGELVIADGTGQAVGLAGVMGGGNSEVRATTTRVFLECAEFDPVAVRKTALRHAKRTEAALRFEKGVDPEGQRWAVSRLAQLIVELAGGRVTGAVAAWKPNRDPAAAAVRQRSVEVEKAYFSRFLGMKIADPEAKAVFEKGLGYQVSEGRIASGAETWKVRIPSYRMDLRAREDLAEEVALGLGYDRIESTLPDLTSVPTALGSNWAAGALAVVDRAKDALVGLGLREALNYGFSSQAWLGKFGIVSGVKVLNPLSAEHECMVPSLLPGLVANAVYNWNHSFGSEKPAIRLFELRPTFHAGGAIAASAKAGAATQDATETGVDEIWKLAFFVSGPRLADGLKTDLLEADFYDVKGIVESLLQTLGTKGARWQPLSEGSSAGNLCHPGQASELWVGKASVGFLGRVHPGRAKELDIRDTAWVCELDWAAIAGLSRTAMEASFFRRWSEFPPVERDFALVVRDQVQAGALVQAALKAGKPFAKSAKVFDVYRGHPVPEGMTSVAIRVIFSDDTRSLVEAEVEGASAQILKAWEREFPGAQLRS